MGIVATMKAPSARRQGMLRGRVLLVEQRPRSSNATCVDHVASGWSPSAPFQEDMSPPNRVSKTTAAVAFIRTRPAPRGLPNRPIMPRFAKCGVSCHQVYTSASGRPSWYAEQTTEKLGSVILRRSSVQYLLFISTRATMLRALKHAIPSPCRVPISTRDFEWKSLASSVCTACGERIGGASTGSRTNSEQLASDI